MRAKSKLFVALGIALAASSNVSGQAPANTLVVAKAATAPVIDGSANDAAWAAAQPLTSGHRAVPISTTVKRPRR